MIEIIALILEYRTFAQYRKPMCKSLWDKELTMILLQTRQDRINEYLAVNQNMKVVGLREASAIWVVGDKYILKGGKKMVVFKYGAEPLELEPNADVTSFVV